MTPYYEDDAVTLYHGDCRDIDAWLSADVLVTDPPYGIAWKQPQLPPGGTRGRIGSPAHVGISNDTNTAVRDHVLNEWLPRPAVVFGAPNRPLPANTRQTLVWQKPPNAGIFGTVAGFRRDWEAIYLMGDFPASTAQRSSVIRSSGDHTGYLKAGEGHPHAKPEGLMSVLLGACPPGTIADPFTGSGTTLLAAKTHHRRAIGVELDERYCEIAARRLSQDAFTFDQEPA